MRNQINQLKLGYFDNIYDLALSDKEFSENGGNKFLFEYEDIYLNNFIDFHIDGKQLIKVIWKDDYRIFLNYNIGLLGFKSKAHDELMINYLLKKNISTHDVENAFKRYNLNCDKLRIEQLTKHFNKSDLFVYACKICADGECGGIKLKIDVDSQFYYWTIFPNYKFRFNKISYEIELERYIDKIRHNGFASEIFQKLYLFNIRQNT